MENKQDFDYLYLIEEYREKLLIFYAPYFEDKKSLTEFVGLALNYDEKYSQVRFMIQQVERFVTLANDIDKIRPARDPLRIFFLKTCLESLCDISKSNKKEFFNEFENCFSDKGIEYIISHFKFTGINRPSNPSIQQLAILSNIESKKITIKSFLKIIKAVRDNVAHEGDCWSTQFFVQKTDSTYITDLTTKENIFDIEKDTWNKILDCFEQGKVTYFLHTKLDYSKLIFYFVQACIGFIENQQKTS